MVDFLTRLDGCLGTLGLASDPWLVSGRKVHGTIDGRTVEGNISARSTAASGPPAGVDSRHRLGADAARRRGGARRIGAIFPAGQLPASIALQARPGCWFFSVLGDGDWLVERASLLG
jgi:hypothetical protein